MEVVKRMDLTGRETIAKAELTTVKSPDYIASLKGTLGADYDWIEAS